MAQTRTAPAPKAWPPNYQKSLEVLVSGHSDSDENLEAIYLSPDPECKEIRLVEVTSQVGYTGEAMAFGFGASNKDKVFYPSKIVLLHPQEWEEFKAKKLHLPDGWSRALKQLWPSQ